MNWTNLISVEDLTQRLSAVRILDCRADLFDATAGERAFLEAHIPGAVHADLEQHLSYTGADRLQIRTKHGRHPLPERATWLEQVRAWGITNSDQVVVYDAAGGAFGARAWWLLRWLGHANVAVLNGGWEQWQDNTESGNGATHGTSDFAEAAPLTRLVATAEITAMLGAADATAPACTLLDARSEVRFAGEEELVDPIAGHIPGAQCRPYNLNLDAHGKFLPAQELAQAFAACGADPVVYCGSGVSATHHVLAMHVAGLPEPGLYADSWSGWITDPTRPIGRGR